MMKIHPIKLRNIKKNLSLVLFVFLLIASFVALNATSGLLFSNHKLDLTKNKRYTLRPQTVEILKNLPHPITVNVYYSSSISKDYPLYSQYAQMVLHTLDRYRNISGNKIKINLLNPEPYTSIEEDAIKFGLKKISTGEGKITNYFGAVMTNTEGKSYTIPYFDNMRQNYLENDLTRAISSLSTFTKKNIGVISPDIKMIDTSYRGRKADKDWTFIKLLRQDYNIVEISANIPEIPLEIDSLIVASTSELPASSMYALDQFLMRGGNVLFLIDPYSEIENVSKGITSEKGSNINILLKNWGIQYAEDLIVGDKKLSQEISFADGSVKKYYPWININSEYFSKDSPLTLNLSDLYFQTAGGLELFPKNNININTLITTGSESTLTDARIAKFAEKTDVIDNSTNAETPIVISAMSEGTNSSIFKSSPYAQSDFAEELLPFLPASITPAKIIVITDIDWLYHRNWILPAYSNNTKINEIVPINNNFDFLLRSIDYLNDNIQHIAIGNKDVGNRNDTLRKRIENITAIEYATRYREVLKDVEQQKIKLNTLLDMINRQEISASIKNYSEMQEMQRNLQKRQEELSRIEYKIKEKSENMINIIVATNILLFPTLILCMIVLFVYLSRRRSSKSAERLINE